MAARLINLAKVLVGWIRGGLAVVNIFASTLFGTISGSSVADTASVGSIMIPQMVKQGYPRVFSVNLTICGSVQAVLIPPSHNAVIYSIAAGGSVSIAHLFLAGILPGLLFGLCLVGLVLWTAQKRHMPKAEILTFRESLKVAADSFWGLGTVFIIIGGILSGVFTATESAAIACVYAFIVTMFIYRDYKWSELPLLIGRVVRTVGMVMIMIGFSIAFGYMMAIMRVPAIARFAVITTPRWTRSTLNALASGRKSGAVRRSAGSGSMKMPRRSSDRLTSSRNIHCSCATVWTHSASCIATCSAVSSHAIAAVAPSTSITTALVWKALRTRRGRSRQPMSPYRKSDTARP